MLVKGYVHLQFWQLSPILQSTLSSISSWQIQGTAHHLCPHHSGTSHPPGDPGLPASIPAPTVHSPHAARRLPLKPESDPVPPLLRSLCWSPILLRVIHSLDDSETLYAWPGDLSHLVPSTFSFSAPLGFEPTQHVSTQAPGRSLNLPGMLPSQGLCINVPSTQNALSLQVSMAPPYSVCASNQTPPLPLKFFSVSCFDFFIAVLPPTCSMWSCMFVYCLSPLQVTARGSGRSSALLSTWHWGRALQTYLEYLWSSTTLHRDLCQFTHHQQCTDLRNWNQPKCIPRYTLLFSR